MTALVRGVSLWATDCGEMLKVDRSTSAKTGVAPQYMITLAVATQVKDGRITSSPGPMPMAASIRCNPVVQLLVARAWGVRDLWAKAVSNSATLGPWVSQPEASGARHACHSSSPVDGSAMGMILELVLSINRMLNALWAFDPGFALGMAEPLLTGPAKRIRVMAADYIHGFRFPDMLDCCYDDIWPRFSYPDVVAAGNVAVVTDNKGVFEFGAEEAILSDLPARETKLPVLAVFDIKPDAVKSSKGGVLRELMQVACGVPFTINNGNLRDDCTRFLRLDKPAGIVKPDAGVDAEGQELALVEKVYMRLFHEMAIG